MSRKIITQIICMVVKRSRLASIGTVVNPARGELKRESFFVCPRSRPSILVWRDRFGLPSRVRALILDTQAESGAYSRALFLPPGFHAGIHHPSINSANRRRVIPAFIR